MSKISNVISMIELLSTGRKYSINDLSNILEVSPRMIRVYKEELEKANIFIDSIKGKYGGYVLNQGIKIIHDENKNKVNLDEQEIKVFNALSSAIKSKKKVKILYYSYNKGDNERIIHPFTLQIYGDKWGCSAYCETRSDLRHFELSRIKNIEILNETY